MQAVDSDILVRLLVGDGGAQFEAAQSLLKTHQIWIAKTVLLETNWQLCREYKYRREEVLAAFQRLSGLGMVMFEDPTEIAEALRLMAFGIDFADALHLASRGPCEHFVTFDVKLLKRASKAGVDGVATPAARVEK
jgi:predicted nucleic-acid-binding protein